MLNANLTMGLHINPLPKSCIYHTPNFRQSEEMTTQNGVLITMNRVN